MHIAMWLLAIIYLAIGIAGVVVDLRAYPNESFVWGVSCRVSNPILNPIVIVLAIIAFVLGWGFCLLCAIWRRWISHRSD